MRRSVKKKLEKILFTMGTAETVLSNLCQHKQTKKWKGLLEDLQASAIMAGGVAEETEGEDCEFVHGLEEYCDILWECANAATVRQKQDLIRLLKSQREYLMQQVLCDIPECSEIVFLPQSDGDWTILEPYWRLAMEEPDWNCTVMQRQGVKKHQSRTEKSYRDGGWLPDYVPTMDIRTYDLNKELPDIVVMEGIYAYYIKKEDQVIARSKEGETAFMNAFLKAVKSDPTMTDRKTAGKKIFMIDS